MHCLLLSCVSCRLPYSVQWLVYLYIWASLDYTNLLFVENMTFLPLETRSSMLIPGTHLEFICLLGV